MRIVGHSGFHRKEGGQWSHPVQADNGDEGGQMLRPAELPCRAITATSITAPSSTSASSIPPSSPPTIINSTR